MQLALSASAGGLSTFALQFIDRSFDHRLIGEKGLNKLSDLIEKTAKD
jgi:hypothetical protein